jgi:hypothetical protein
LGILTGAKAADLIESIFYRFGAAAQGRNTLAARR